MRVRLLTVLAYCGIVLAGCISSGNNRQVENPPARQDRAADQTEQPVARLGEPEPALDADQVRQLVPAGDDVELADDRLEDRPAPPLVEEVVDRRPLGAWQVNASAAVLKLDIPKPAPDSGDALFTLRPSYAAAITAARATDPDTTVLPSVNLLDGKAKQFDDGLYAALDRAYCRGLTERLHSHVDFVRRCYERVGKDSPAAPFLAAALEIAHVRVEVTDRQAKERWLTEFEKSQIASKPIGFYTWNKELTTCFRFLRFLGASSTRKRNSQFRRPWRKLCAIPDCAPIMRRCSTSTRI